jgi:hypothetical protein
MHPAHAATGPNAEIGGLVVAASNMLLFSHPTRLEPGYLTPFVRILDQSGQRLTSFVEQHERAMHLIVLRRDLFRFQHPASDSAPRRHLDDRDHPADGWRMAGVRRLRHRPGTDRAARGHLIADRTP